MKKFKITGVFLPLMLVFLVSACSSKKVAENPIKTTILKIKSDDGTNGTAVVYNPTKKLYYAAIAGNIEFPLEVFDEKGNNMNTREAEFDVRGMWWNAGKKALEANGYSEFGVTQYALNASGYPESNTKLTTQSGQPSDQAVGAYDDKHNHIIYYFDGAITKVNRSDFSVAGTVSLALPVSKDFINSTTVIYTGVKGKEAGVLDYENKKVYLFNLSNGEHTHTVNLPGDAVTHEMFRFSFANGHVWLYDTETRSWTGYKLF